MASQEPDIMAFVKYQHQVFVASLNPYDGYEQWIKVLSGLAPCPVEVVLMADKAVSDRSQGIPIVDRRSFLEAMKAVEKTRQKNEVLRIALYPLEETAKKHVPLSRVHLMTTKKPSEEAAQKAFRIVSGTSEVSPGSAATLNPKKDDTVAPPWAAEMKKELADIMDARFQELNRSFEEKMSLLGSQMKESMTTSLRSSLSGVSSSSNIFTASSPSALSPSVVVLSPRNLKQTVEGREAAPMSAINEQIQMAASTSEIGFDSLSDHVDKDSSDIESVVLVSQPDSSNIELEAFDNQTVGGKSESVEIITAEHIQGPEFDNVSDSGSVVYVDTDGEDEEDAFSNLRSWAADGAMSASKKSSSLKMVDSVGSINQSMQSSFHSTISERQEAPPVQETIVYKSYPVPQSPTNGSGLDIRHESQDVFVGNLENSTEDSATATRPVPLNGSAQLPINLNAMKSVDEQNLFSPNSDIGTMLLSAASSIANGFLQSMESLSKVLNEYEARHAAQKQSSTPQSDLNMDAVSSGTIEVPHVEVSAEPEVAPPEVAPAKPEVSVHSRGPRGPPPSTGPYMSWEQMTWYFNEYGMPNMIKAAWVNDRITIEEFNARITEHFDHQDIM